MTGRILSPFPYFGGKRVIAPLVWERFGNVPNYTEPFAGSLAVLLARPHEPGTETVNDLDGYISNFWRAVQAAPADVAGWADWPVNENDLHARHAWLLARRDGLQQRLEGDPDYFDAHVAGWWLWGICAWIGGGWCAGVGPWQALDGELVNVRGSSGGTWRQRPHLGNAGQGITRPRPRPGRRPGGGAGAGACAEWRAHLETMMQTLADRLRRVRVCCGDWSRICGPTPTVKQGITGVFLDPPYAHGNGRDDDLYRVDQDVTADVRRWALEWGDDPRMRIALCAYDEHDGDMPATWERVAWKARGGYGSHGNGVGRANAAREVLWFSPHCLKPDRPVQGVLWGTAVLREERQHGDTAAD